MKIRVATERDVPTLRDIYRDAVTSLGPSAYTLEQTNAWAQTADSRGLHQLIVSSTTYVAEMDNRIVGFCALQSDGRIALLYVLSSYGRRGIGSELLSWALEQAGPAARGAFYAEASEFSLALFRKLGFSLVRTERILWNGVELPRYLVRKDPC